MINIVYHDSHLSNGVLPVLFSQLTAYPIRKNCSNLHNVVNSFRVVLVTSLDSRFSTRHLRLPTPYMSALRIFNQNKYDGTLSHALIYGSYLLVLWSSTPSCLCPELPLIPKHFRERWFLLQFHTLPISSV